MISRNSTLSGVSIIILLIILSFRVSGPMVSEVRKFKVVPVQEFNISIGENWTLLSTPVRPVYYSNISKILSPLENWSFIRTYDNVTFSPYCWGTAINDGPRDFNEVDVIHGYWLQINESGAPDKLKVDGILLPEVEIPLIEGWNLIGYPSNATRTVDDVLAQIQFNWTTINAYDPFTGNWSHAVPWAHIDPPKGIENITPGKGYWLNVKSNITLLIQNNVSY